MNKYLKEYLKRGLIFGGFGPIVVGIVLAILQICSVAVNLNGTQAFIAIFSSYLLAFVHAGSSVFNQIEAWPVTKSTAFHLSSLYVAYSICYLINGWIPMVLEAFLIFTAIFVVAYFVIWLTVYLIVKNTSKKLNNSIRRTF